MDTNLVLTWLVVAACVLNAKPVLKVARAGRPSLLIVFVAIVAVAAGGSLLHFSATGKLCALLFALLVVLPGLLQRRLWRLNGAQRYDDALPYARALAVLHPAGGFPQLPALLRALSLAQRGQQAEAEALLSALAEGPSNPIRSDALAQLARMRADWSQYLARTQQLSAAALDLDLGALLGRLRALGETGQLSAMLALHSAHDARLRATNARVMRAHARLFLFAFTGHTRELEQVLSGPLAQLPPAMAEYWRATCAYAAGEAERARSLLEPLLAAPSRELRRAAERRLDAPPTVAGAVLSLASQHALQELSREQVHDTTYDDQAPLKRSFVTLTMLALNLLTFAAEELLGGSEDGATLYRLGAAVTGMLTLPESYRLLTALFLHFGVLHLSLNMLNLALIGPFVESSLGRLRTLSVYLASGLCGSLLVSLIPQEQPGLFLGASGCIMGLLGATAGILLHGHRSERSQTARGRLQRLALPLLLQLAFDLSVPGISLTAHWSGVFVGLSLGQLFQRRVRALAGTSSQRIGS